MASEVSESRGNSYTGDLNRGGSIRPVGVHTSLRGKLHLRLADIGMIFYIKQSIITLHISYVTFQISNSGSKSEG